MAKRNKKQTRRVKKLIFICSMFAIILTVATYAWFIGMKTVRVSSFEIDIATTEGLFLSMNGNDWYYNLDARNTQAYNGNTNTWAEDGLIPMSTVGDMDPVSSRMKLFEKASLTTTYGGYRLLASRVQNYATSADDGKFLQGEGYVAFDLFIKNLSGNAYYTENKEENEEAIYLTTDSVVTVAENGGESGTGIENSVRVAFAQVGRVQADTSSVKNITDISCSNVAKGDGQVQVTGICRSAQIWEPNDKEHVQNAINWYETSCLTRDNTLGENGKPKGADLTSKSSYDTAKTTTCGQVIDGEANSTYAVSREITVEDNIDVYDGADFNGYTHNSVDYKTIYKPAIDKSSFKLVDFPYFTDTMKNTKSAARPVFMTLAPNSITKVRVYIYIEGQDIDNYDFASLGKKISVKFGFTKERYDVEGDDKDFGYNGPSTDITPDGTDIVATQAQ